VSLHTLLIAALVGLGVWLAAIAVLFVLGRRLAAREIATLIPNLLRLFRGLVRDPRLPRRTKVLLLVGVVWLVSPIDLIPEFIPVLGPLDDAVVAALILRHVVKVAGLAVLAEHWRGDPATLERITRVLRIVPAPARENAEILDHQSGANR
jgi:uncharacterized membrane protein YkvA (DUF1232 family)